MSDSSESTTRIWPGAIGLLLFAVGCASAQIAVNTPELHSQPTDARYRFSSFPATQTNTDSIFVVLTFSGGGTRAAALSYGVLRELSETMIDSGRATRSLLGEVDLISSVSGGSFTAAAFASSGFSGLDRYEHAFLRWKAEDALKKRGVIEVLSWIHLFGGSFGRSDVAAGLWNDSVFHGITFGDLVRQHQRPFLFINAEDMAAAAPYTFTDEWLAPTCIDLNKLPVARAVAASSAFPGLLEPMTFENHAGQCGFHQPKWVDVGLLNRSANSESYHRAQLYLSYSDSKKRHFLHLIDGGPADNLGVRPVIRSLFSAGADPSIQAMVADSLIRHLLIVVVNARTDENTEIERTPDVPGVISVLSSAASTPFGNYTEESLKRIRDYATSVAASAHEGVCVDQLLSKLHPGRHTIPRRFAEVSVAELGLDQIADPHRRATLEAVQTTFQLPDSTVTQLIAAGRDLLRSNADFGRAVRAMQFRSTVADTAKVPCQQ